jgi:hypothetical protein
LKPGAFKLWVGQLSSTCTAPTGDEPRGVDDGEVGAVLVLNLHHDVFGPEAVIVLQALVLGLDVAAQVAFENPNFETRFSLDRFSRVETRRFLKRHG